MKFNWNFKRGGVVLSWGRYGYFMELHIVEDYCPFFSFKMTTTGKIFFKMRRETYNPDQVQMKLLGKRTSIFKPTGSLIRSQTTRSSAIVLLCF